MRIDVQGDFFYYIKTDEFGLYFRCAYHDKNNGAVFGSPVIWDKITTWLLKVE